MAAITSALGVKLVRLGWSMKNSLVVLLVQFTNIGYKYIRSDPLMLVDNADFTL